MVVVVVVVVVVVWEAVGVQSFGLSVEQQDQLWSQWRSGQWFGDKSGLAMALLGSAEAELQQRMLSGPPPLGPGADTTSRLAAFVETYLELVVDQLDLVLMSQTAAVRARHRSGVHAFWRTHCRMLLAEAQSPAPELRAEVLLAAMGGEQVSYWTRTRGLSVTELRRDLAALAVELAVARGRTTPPAE